MWIAHGSRTGERFAHSVDVVILEGVIEVRERKLPPQKAVWDSCWCCRLVQHCTRGRGCCRVIEVNA